MYLIIRQEYLSSVIKKSKKSPIEICGLLLGRRGENTFRVEEVHFITNRLNSPAGFEMDPLEMIRAIDGAEKRGIEVVGIFHSHTRCPPRPSGRDLRGMKLWPVVWLIVDREGNYGAYVLRNGRAEKVDVKIV